MDIFTANHLLCRPLPEQRPVMAPSPHRTKEVACLLEERYGEMAVVSSTKYKERWEVPLSSVRRR
jgi:hypothetical protein